MPRPLGSVGDLPTGTDQALMLAFHQLRWSERMVAAGVCQAWKELVHSAQVWETVQLTNSAEPYDTLRLLARAPQSVLLKIQEVNLEFAAGVSDALTGLLSCLRLTRLNLNACQQVSHAAICRIAAQQTKLQRLELYWNTNVRDATLYALGGCMQLRHLSLSGCSHITDDGVRTLAACCTMLTTLDLTRCLRVTDAGYEGIAGHCRQLQELRMYACSGITDRTLIACGAHLALRVVDICGANSVTDSGLSALARGSQQLRYLNLTWCIRLQEPGLLELAACCHRLRWLSLHGILGVTDACLHALAEATGRTLLTLDVNGCRNAPLSKDATKMQQLFPHVTCWHVHS